MSADILREAAALMRARAEKADLSGDGEPWFSAADLHELIGAGSRNTSDAEHLSSWHPAVALTVADWLDRAAVLYPHEPEDPRFPGSETARALDVARAYLGRAS